MDCLLKENVELRAKAEESDALQTENKELKDRVKEAEKEVKAARTERDRSKEIAQQVSKFLGSLGDVLNKAQLFDHGLKQPATDSGVKMMRCMIDYSQKMEKTLKELHTLLQPTRGRPEQAGTPGAGPSTTPAPTASFVTPLATRPDPLLQEPIPVLNTNEMANLRNWAEGGLKALATPTTGTGLNPVNLSTPRSASQEHQRWEEERTKRRADEEESDSSSSEEEESHPSPSTQTKSMEIPIHPRIWADQKRPCTKSTGRLPGRLPERSPLGPSARPVSKRNRVVVVVRRIKGGKVRPA